MSLSFSLCMEGAFCRRGPKGQRVRVVLLLALPHFVWISRLFLCGLRLSRFARVVSAFEIGLDLVERKPRGFELPLRIQIGLIEVMLRLRVGALAELQQRHRAR